MPQRAPIQNQLNALVIDTTPVITSQKTPGLPTNSDKLGKIKENVMTMKSFTMKCYLGNVHYDTVESLRGFRGMFSF